MSHSLAADIKGLRDFVQELPADAWISPAQMGPAALWSGTESVEHAFRRSLCHHLERTSHSLIGGKIPRNVSLLALLDSYPGLAWLWDKQIKGWARFVSDFFSHTTAFVNFCRPELTIRRIEPDFSDPHRCGRSVVRVRLSDNSVWYYKPRSGQQEAAWRRLIEALNSAGFETPLRSAKVQVRRNHCWMSSIPARRCRNARERSTFGQRVGALLYLAHIFKAVDLHSRNVVTCGSHPVVVDCECFFHPETRLPPHMFTENRNSLVRTGMFVATEETADWPLAVTQLSPRSSSISCSRKEVINGFQAMHEFLRSARHNCDVKRARDRLQRLSTRCIYRPTRYYLFLLNKSLAAEMLREPGRRCEFLYSQLDDGLCPTAIVQKEVSQLLVGDIPIFNGHPTVPRHYLSNSRFRRALLELQVQ